jgi:hypothetical protein
MLPPDRGELVADLQRRIAVSASASFQAAGTVRALAGIFERPSAFRGFAGACTAFGVALSSVSAFGSMKQWDAVPKAVRGDIVTSALATPVLILSIPVSLVMASWIGRWRYRATVRPYLVARAPRFEGGAARCRVCGADLPAAATPIVACRFCATESIVSHDLYAERAAFLERERMDHLARARGLAPMAQRISSWIGAAMGLAFVGSIAAASGFLWIAHRALVEWIR